MNVIISRRCDYPMRRSKEKCNTPYHTEWHCTEDCRNCICCLIKYEDGTEAHVNPMFKGIVKDEC